MSSITLRCQAHSSSLVSCAATVLVWGPGTAWGLGRQAGVWAVGFQQALGTTLWDLEAEPVSPQGLMCQKGYSPG